MSEKSRPENSPSPGWKSSFDFNARAMISPERREELVEELRREFRRGADKIITPEGYPIRWFLLQTLIGMCINLMVLFSLNMTPLPELPHFIQFWSVLLISPIVNLIRIIRIVRRGRAG